MFLLLQRPQAALFTQASRSSEPWQSQAVLFCCEQNGLPGSTQRLGRHVMERKPKTKQAETQVSFPHLYHWILPLIPFSSVFFLCQEWLDPKILCSCVGHQVRHHLKTVMCGCVDSAQGGGDCSNQKRQHRSGPCSDRGFRRQI